MTTRHRSAQRSRPRWVRMLGLTAGAAVLVGLGSISGAPAGEAPPRTSGALALDGVAPTPVTPPAAPTGPESPDTPARTRPAPQLAPSDPRTLLVPSLDLEVDVMDLGLTGAGTLETPPGAFPAGWYTGSPSPGELGPAVLAGHVSYNGALGVFADLAALRPGDEVVVGRDDGSTARFVVTRTVDYAKSAFPTEAVYGDIDHAGLRLITCGGLDPASGTFEENLVVYAELVDSEPATQP